MTLVLGPSEGATLDVFGNRLTFKTRAEDTGGALSVIEYEMAPGFGGPPSHTHAGFSEAFYVLRGEPRFTVGGETITGSPGSFVFVSGDTSHSFANPGDPAGAFLLMITPGGFERYFEELVERASSYPPPRELMAELNRRYGVQMGAPASRT